MKEMSLCLLQHCNGEADTVKYQKSCKSVNKVIKKHKGMYNKAEVKL